MSGRYQSLDEVTSRLTLRRLPNRRRRSHRIRRRNRTLRNRRSRGRLSSIALPSDYPVKATEARPIRRRHVDQRLARAEIPARQARGSTGNLHGLTYRLGSAGVAVARSIGHSWLWL